MACTLRVIPHNARVSNGRMLYRLAYSRGRSLVSTAGGDEASWKYDHDVVVVGGGIVGCSLACRLAEDVTGGISSSSGGIEGGNTARPSIGLVEAAPPKPLEAVLSRDGYDPRVYALTPSSVGVLKRIGVWDSFGKRGDIASEAGESPKSDGVKDCSQSFGSMQVWDDRGPGYVRFSGKTGRKKSRLGFISEHGVLHSALFERVRELDGAGHVELTCPAQVKRVVFPPDGAAGTRGPMTVFLETKDGETREVTCRLLVAADGGESKVAKMLGLPAWGWGYGQRAVVANVRLAGSHDNVAFQRYLSRGPLAMLPLSGDYASLVWSTTPEHAEQLKALDPGQFLTEVNDALRLPPRAGSVNRESSGFTASGPAASAGVGSKKSFFPPEFNGLEAGLPKFPLKDLPTAMNPIALAHTLAGGIIDSIEGVSGALAGLSGGLSGVGVQEFSLPPEAVEVVGPRLGFDLSLRQAHSYTGPRAALVGDAAHTIHPMAGQGLNLGLADADALARTVLDGRLSGTDLGSEALLSLYEKERKMDALVMMGTLDFLHRLFGTEGRGVAAVRSAGLSAFNLSGPIKERIMLHAMGERGA